MSRLTSCSVLLTAQYSNQTAHQAHFGTTKCGQDRRLPYPSTTQELIIPSWSFVHIRRVWEDTRLGTKGQSDDSSSGTRQGDGRRGISHRDSDSFSKRPHIGSQLH
ncbi:hypothetical protein AVEN_222892-1 [Araneus ventricosus]|uniref:Uncharacterized protein n=1 Tax=Araneus ventricosus TaxID=182803 RepID=A0A4Y2V329_ARAVE|nr:hypothetical protein AVEN_34145-1 [Araneus ventricosus]GBO18155.1 hypothetical protein AVEN_222892-1 [Araneus ventricosus]